MDKTKHQIAVVSAHFALPIIAKNFATPSVTTELGLNPKVGITVAMRFGSNSFLPMDEQNWAKFINELTTAARDIDAGLLEEDDFKHMIVLLQEQSETPSAAAESHWHKVHKTTMDMLKDPSLTGDELKAIAFCVTRFKMPPDALPAILQQVVTQAIMIGELENTDLIRDQVIVDCLSSFAKRINTALEQPTDTTTGRSDTNVDVVGSQHTERGFDVVGAQNDSEHPAGENIDAGSFDRTNDSGHHHRAGGTVMGTGASG